MRACGGPVNAGVVDVCLFRRSKCSRYAEMVTVGRNVSGTSTERPERLQALGGVHDNRLGDAVGTHDLHERVVAAPRSCAEVVPLHVSDQSGSADSLTAGTHRLLALLEHLVVQIRWSLCLPIHLYPQFHFLSYHFVLNLELIPLVQAPSFHRLDLLDILFFLLLAMLPCIFTCILLFTTLSLFDFSLFLSLVQIMANCERVVSEH